MNSEPSLVTPSEFNICPRTLTAPPLLSVQATTMSPLRSCVTAHPLWSPAIVVLTVRWDPSFEKLIALPFLYRGLAHQPDCRRAHLPDAAALPAAARSGGGFHHCPWVARAARRFPCCVFTRT